jgi:hypothetical protein
VKPASLNFIIYNPISPLLPASLNRRLMEFESGTIGRLGSEQEFELQIVADSQKKPQYDVKSHLLCDSSSQYGRECSLAILSGVASSFSPEIQALPIQGGANSASSPQTHEKPQDKTWKPT